MKKLILSIISLSLMFFVGVYNVKDASRVHIMKFTGEFTIVYEDIRLFSEDTTLVQPLFFDTISISIISFILLLTISIRKSFKLQHSYLAHSSRAPPFSV